MRSLETVVGVILAALVLGVASPAHASFEEARSAFGEAVAAAERRDLASAKLHWLESLELLRVAQRSNPGDLRPHHAEVHLYEFAAGLAAEASAKAEWQRRAELKRGQIAGHERREREREVRERRQAAAQSAAFLEFQGAFQESNRVSERKGLSAKNVKGATKLEEEALGGDAVAKKRAEWEEFEKVEARRDDTLRHEAPDPTKEAMDVASLLANTAIAVHTGSVNFRTIRDNISNFGKGDPNPYGFGYPAVPVGTDGRVYPAYGPAYGPASSEGTEDAGP